MIGIISLCAEPLSEHEFVAPLVLIVQKTGAKVSVIHYKKVTKAWLLKTDAVILSGTALKDFAYLDHLKKFSWLTHYEKPVLGICAGMQVLVAQYLNDCFSRREEIGIVQTTFQEPMLGCINTLPTYALHSVGFKSVGSKFNVYATSPSGIQAIKHSTLPHYGVLFHPEVKNKTLIETFVELAKKV